MKSLGSITADKPLEKDVVFVGGEGVVSHRLERGGCCDLFWGGSNLMLKSMVNHLNTSHILGDRLIPEQLL